MSEENTASQPLAAGSNAPDFSLPSRSGKTISLKDFAGQKDVLVYFYPKDDTPGCTREACSLRDSWSDLTKAGIEVLGISRDDAATHNAFAAKYNLPFELLTDADHSVHEAYGAWGQNPNPAWGVGPLRKSFLVGKDGRIRNVFDKVDTEHHAEQVLRAAGIAPSPRPAPAPKPAAPAPPAPKPAVSAAPPAPAAAAPAPKPAAPKPPAPKPAAPKPAAPKPAAPKAAPAKKAKKAVKKAVKKVVRRAKKAVVKAKVRKAVRKAVKKAVRKKAAPKTRAAKRTARRSARKAVRKVRRAARKVRRTVRRVKRASRKAKKAGKKR